ncbi:hypothetical protein F7725_003770, partial [Dissostichus mawsoni]
YKTTKVQENVDWESCKCKYSDISRAFHVQYPRTRADKDFPHDANAITKVQLTAKLKQIRTKYRQLVNTGSRSHQGRVMLLFFELCEEVWGGSPFTRNISSPATRTIRSLSSGIETGDLEESSSGQSSSPSLERSKDFPQPQSSQSSESLPAAVVKQRRDLLQPKLNSHRSDRVKRTFPADYAVQEDIQIKRRMMGTMEQTSSRNADNMQQINANFASITSTIQESFSLMRELMHAHPHNVLCCLFQNRRMEPQEVEHVNRRSSSRIQNQKRLKYEIDDGDKKTNEEEEEDQEDDEQPKHIRTHQENTTKTRDCNLWKQNGNPLREECIMSEGRWFDPTGYEIFGESLCSFGLIWCKPLQEEAQNEEEGAHRVSPIDDPIDISTTVQPSEEQSRERFTQATSTPTIKPEILEKTEDTETASVQTPLLLVTHITGNTRNAASNTAYEGKEEILDTACPQRELDDGCHDETEVTTSGHDAAQLQVMETETRVPQASKSTPVSTSCNLDTMDLEQLKREKIKMKLKIMKLQEEYYTLKIREIKK